MNNVKTTEANEQVWNKSAKDQFLKEISVPWGQIREIVNNLPKEPTFPLELEKVRNFLLFQVQEIEGFNGGNGLNNTRSKIERSVNARENAVRSLNSIVEELVSLRQVLLLHRSLLAFKANEEGECLQLFDKDGYELESPRDGNEEAVLERLEKIGYSKVQGKKFASEATKLLEHLTLKRIAEEGDRINYNRRFKDFIERCKRSSKQLREQIEKYTEQDKNLYKLSLEEIAQTLECAPTNLPPDVEKPTPALDSHIKVEKLMTQLNKTVEGQHHFERELCSEINLSRTQGITSRIAKSMDSGITKKYLIPAGVASLASMLATIPLHFTFGAHQYGLVPSILLGTFAIGLAISIYAGKKNRLGNMNDLNEFYRDSLNRYFRSNSDQHTFEHPKQSVLESPEVRPKIWSRNANSGETKNKAESKDIKLTDARGGTVLMVGTNIALIAVAPLLVFAMSLGLQTFQKPQLDFVARATNGGHCKVITGSVLNQNDLQVEILTNYKSKTSDQAKRPALETSPNTLSHIIQSARAFMVGLGSKIGELDKPKNTAIISRAAFSHAVEVRSKVADQLKDCADSRLEFQSAKLDSPVFYATHNVITAPPLNDKGKQPLHDHHKLADKEHEHKTTQKDKQHVDSVVVPINLAIQPPQNRIQEDNQKQVNLVSNIFYVNGERAKRFDGKKFVLLPFFPALPLGDEGEIDYLTTSEKAFNFGKNTFSDPEYLNLSYKTQPKSDKPITFLKTVADILKSCMPTDTNDKNLVIDVQGFASYEQFRKVGDETEAERENRNHALAEGRRAAVIGKLKDLLGDSFAKLEFVKGEHDLTYKQLLIGAPNTTKYRLGIAPRFENQNAMFLKLADWLEKPNSDSLDPLRSLFARSVAIEWDELGDCDTVPKYRITSEAPKKH